MAVFLVNQCTFSKLPNVSNDQQQASPATVSSVVGQNGVSTQQPTTPTTNAVVGVGLSSSNICGLKFDSLLELIHHIEDNHINDVEYQGISGPYYNGHPQQHHHHPLHPHHHQIVGPHQQQHIQQQIYSDNQRMQNIINGHWLPTSCILRIFNSTHKQVKKEIVGGDNPIGSPATPLFQPHSQQPTPQPPSIHQQQPMTPQPHTPQQMTPQPHQPLSVEMVAPSPQMCTPTPMDTSNSHHIILASPKIVGNMYHSSPYHVTSGPIATTQMNMTAVTLAGPTVSQPIGAASQLVNVNNSIQAQQLQLQQQPQLQQQAIQMQPQLIPHQHPHQQAQLQPQAQMQSQACTPTPKSQTGPTQIQVANQLQSQVQPQLQPRLQTTAQIPGQLQPQAQLQTQLQGQSQLQEPMAVQTQLQAQIQPQLGQAQQIQNQSQIPTHQSQQIHSQQPSTPQQHPIQPQQQPSSQQSSQSQQQPVKPVSAAKPFKCSDCGRSYKTQKNYNIHVANQHQKEADSKPAAAEFNNTTNKT